jgi:TolB-like protein
MASAGLLSMVVGGCGPRAYRGGDGTTRPDIDEPAMSLTLDRLDIDYLADENVKALLASTFWTETVRRSPAPPLMAVWPIENRTSQHLDEQTDALLASVETRIVGSGDAHVVARARQQALAGEVQLRQGEIFDPATAGRLGRQLGAAYFVTGRITAVDERLRDARRVQYRLFIQVVDVETGLVTFQNEALRTKLMKQ